MKISAFIALASSLATSVSGRPWRFAKFDEEGEFAKRMALRYPAHYIEMPINHFPNSSRYAPHVNGTFSERYFFDADYYKPGGPIILYLSGETSGPNRFENLNNVVKILEQATNGLGVILENRYYGHSHPFQNSSTDNLRFLTNEQVIADTDYFARHAKFPGVNDGNPLDAPWIVYGGSWAGALTAWSLNQYGGPNGSLWGGIASSGVTHATVAYPQWYDPIQEFAPQDCVASINAIIANVDYVFATNNEGLIGRMKGIFGLESLGDEDFAQVISWPRSVGGPLDYPIPAWQELLWDPQYAAYNFWQFCGNVTNVNSPESVTSIDYELSSATQGQPWTNLGNYATYIKNVYLPLCQGAPLNSTECFGTQNQTYWADPANSEGRSYLYTSCTELGFYQVAPAGGPSLISNKLQVPYTQQWCDWAFPAGQYSSIPKEPETWRVNQYGGYSVVADRLAHIDGDQDPWRDACFHSTNVPQRYSLNASDAALHPQLLITGAGHHWDSYGLDGLPGVAREPQFIMQAHEFEIRAVQRWVQEWHNRTTSSYSNAAQRI